MPMTRFRAALLAVLAAIAAVVALTVLHPPMPPVTPGTAAGALQPESDRSSAPDFTGIDAWINSAPLSMPSLRGHVVLVDFWTFSCVNCVRTLPHLRLLASTYASAGLVVVGVHSPEFQFERSTANVRDAVHRLDVTWPVAVDSEMATWNAYGNQYWPAEYLIDRNGRIADVLVGEGNDTALDSGIVQLLGARATPLPVPTAIPSSITPELYAGSERGQLADGEQYPAVGQSATYPDKGPPQQRDAIQVNGTWTDMGEYLQAAGPATVRVNFSADRVYVVAGTPGSGLQVRLRLDGAVVGAANAASTSTGSAFTVSRQDLYPLLRAVPAGRHVVELQVPAGFQLYTFTFG